MIPELYQALFSQGQEPLSSVTYIPTYKQKIKPYVGFSREKSGLNENFWIYIRDDTSTILSVKERQIGIGSQLSTTEN